MLSDQTPSSAKVRYNVVTSRSSPQISSQRSHESLRSLDSLEISISPSSCARNVDLEFIFGVWGDWYLGRDCRTGSNAGRGFCSNGKAGEQTVDETLRRSRGDHPS